MKSMLKCHLSLYFVLQVAVIHINRLDGELAFIRTSILSLHRVLDA